MEQKEQCTLSQLDLIPTQDLFIKVENVATSSTRFEEPLTPGAYNAHIKQRIPASTQKSTKWAVDVFHEWRLWRNFKDISVQDPNWPIPDIKDGPLPMLDYWLAKFITEVKKQDGTPYPPGTDFFIFKEINHL